VIVRVVEGTVAVAGVVRGLSGRRLPCVFKLVRAGQEACTVFAANPVRVVRGSDVDELAAAWTEERALWKVMDRPGLPIGIGWLGYDLGRRFERIRGPALPDATWPEIEFRFYDALVACDVATGRAEIWARDDRAASRAEGEILEAPLSLEAESGPATFGPLLEMEEPQRHLEAVARALGYIVAGDIYQVNLARRLACPYATLAGDAPGGALYSILESATPAPFAIWLADGENGTALVGNSPERFLSRTMAGEVETWPIKGTRPRDLSDHQPQRKVAELLASAKDRAEHVMIVDLERNDLGRVCETGSVQVLDLCQVLTLPTVHHLVTKVRGQLRPNVGLAELLRATFPGGSVTGAPKIRAMELIEELEPARRGPYTGATGWLGAAGDLDLAIAIRTALIRERQLTLWVGGGIVADSLPADELAETWDKAQAFSRALEHHRG
jgi:para-aminobenzoate synthetase component I